MMIKQSEKRIEKAKSDLGMRPKSIASFTPIKSSYRPSSWSISVIPNNWSRLMWLLMTPSMMVVPAVLFFHWVMLWLLDLKCGGMWSLLAWQSSRLLSDLIMSWRNISALALSYLSINGCRKLLRCLPIVSFKLYLNFWMTSLLQNSRWWTLLPLFTCPNLFL